MEDKHKKEVLRRLEVISSKLKSRWESQSKEEILDDIQWIADPIL